MLRSTQGVLEIIPSEPACGKEVSWGKAQVKAGWRKSPAKGTGALETVTGTPSKRMA